MKIIVVDDEMNNLEAFEMEAEGIGGVEIVGKFQDPRKALAYASCEPVDLAVLDVEMPELNGIVLGQELRKCRPDIGLIYITGYEEYAFNAFQLEACAYILKPFNQDDIKRAFIRAGKILGIREVSVERPDVFIQTFGRFEVFVNNRPMQFKSSKAKELMALLVDRKGGIVNTEEILTYLWEDKPDTDSSRSLCRKVIQRLHSNLEEYGIDDIIVRHSRGRSLDAGKVTCDYYDYLDGKEAAVRAFCGEYMTNYSWAEDTLSRLVAYKK